MAVEDWLCGVSVKHPCQYLSLLNFSITSLNLNLAVTFHFLWLSNFCLLFPFFQMWFTTFRNVEVWLRAQSILREKITENKFVLAIHLKLHCDLFIIYYKNWTTEASAENQKVQIIKGWLYNKDLIFLQRHHIHNSFVHNHSTTIMADQNYLLTHLPY